MPSFISNFGRNFQDQVPPAIQKLRMAWRRTPTFADAACCRGSGLTEAAGLVGGAGAGARQLRDQGLEAVVLLFAGQACQLVDQLAVHGEDPGSGITGAVRLRADRFVDQGRRAKQQAAGQFANLVQAVGFA
jgi:hypothetical protein